jgi:hypothetical protein
MRLIILGVLLSAPFLFSNYYDNLYSPYPQLDLTGYEYTYE